MLEYREIISYIFIIGAAQAIYLFVILLGKKENKYANKFLSATMLIFAMDLIGGVLFVSGNISYAPWYLGLNNAFPYLYGPLIYLYILFLIKRKQEFRHVDFLHFLPFIIIQVYGFLFFYFESKEYQLSMLNPDFDQPLLIKLIGMFIPVSGIIYISLSLIEIRKFNRLIKNTFSNIEEVDLTWLNYLIIGTALIWAVVLLSYLLTYIYGEHLQANLLIYIALSIFLYVFAFKSYKLPEFNMLFERRTDSYQKSGLSSEQAEVMLKNIIEVFEKQKIYLDSKLNLAKLSEHTNITTHNISEILNSKLNKNFYDFVNSYRVEEVKKLIRADDKKKFSILALGYEAGFSSKSAFYTAFKKFTGKTPAQFRKDIL